MFGIVGATQPGVAGIVICRAGISRAGIVIAGISTGGTLTPGQQTRWCAFATAGQAVTVVMAATVSARPRRYLLIYSIYRGFPGFSYMDD